MDKEYLQLKGLMKVVNLLPTEKIKDKLVELYLSQVAYQDFIISPSTYYFEFYKEDYRNNIVKFLQNPKCPVKLYKEYQVDDIGIVVYEKKNSVCS